MKRSGWKVLAIVFIVLFLLETSFVLYNSWSYNKEIEKLNICYYDICEDYPQAYYEERVCTCYEYDSLGYIKKAKEKYIE